MSELAILTGSANRFLAESVANILGVSVGQSRLERFPDTELHVEIQETVRGREVYLIQPTGPPVDRNLMELLFLVDACRRAGAAEVSAVIPYFGYSRQDRRTKGSEALGARLVADLLKSAGVGRVVALDLHTASIEGVFGVALEQLSAVGPMCSAISDRLSPNSVVVSPDLGAAKLAERYARLLRLPMAIVHKVRTTALTVEARSVIGEVRNRKPLLVDDMISTAGTIHAALHALSAAGCEPGALVAATHGLFTGQAAERLASLPIEHLFVTDSLEVQRPAGVRVSVISIAPLLAEVISRLHSGQSLGDLIAHT